MGVDVKVTDTGGGAVTVSLKNLSQAITIGVHEGAGSYPGGVTVATVAAAHEFGTTDIPQRSWLRGYLATGGQDAIAKAGAQQMAKVVDGASVDTVSEAMGAVAVKGITERIEQGAALQPLAPATLADPNRDSRGIPLLDTGLLVDSITWEPA